MCRKVAIIGAGAIGTTLAYALALRNRTVDIVLANRDEKKAWAKAFDISHCLPELPDRSVRSGGIEDCAGAAVVVLTVGVLPRETGTRADVLRDNIEVYRGIVPRLAELCPSAVFLVVTNPLDAMAYAAYRLALSPRGRVIGSGTALDALRLRAFTAEAYSLDASRLRIEVVGEHGDSMVPLWSGASYDDRPLPTVLAEAGTDFNEESRASLLQRTRRAGWDIRLAGEHSTYGIAFSAARIVETLLSAEGGVLSVSALRDEGEAALDGGRCVYLSLPTRLGREGAAPGGATITMDENERAALYTSARLVRAQMDAVDTML
jgi:L-lactate dehydrogenase